MYRDRDPVFTRMNGPCDIRLKGRIASHMGCHILPVHIDLSLIIHRPEVQNQPAGQILLAGI